MLSIVTPSYNRGYLLGRLFDSLKVQNNYNFEWIIIDDGSTDDTKEIIKEIQDGCYEFPIIYVYQENGGKHRAINSAIKNANGEFIFIVDSDDYITQDAVNTIEQWTKEIVDKNEIAGVSGLRAYGDGKIIGGFGNIKGNEYIEITNLQRKQYGLLGDKAEIYKREILLKYPFPEFENEKFLPEEAVWNIIARDGYKLRWYKKIIYYTEYLEDGLTYAVKYKNLEWNNFMGYTYVVALNLECYKNLKTKSMIFINYYRMAKKKGYDLYSISKFLNISNLDAIFYLCLGNIGLVLIEVFNKVRR